MTATTATPSSIDGARRGHAACPRPARAVRALFTGTRFGLPALALAAAAAANAQTRWVVVNGERLSDAQIAHYDRLQCTTVPDGHYWLNPRTGVWGYAGDPRPQGRLGDGCAQEAPGGVNADGTYGPFATLRRAEQEAESYRARGLRAVAFHNGVGYFVRVSR